MGSRIRRIRNWLPVDRKTIVSAVLLLLMGGSLLFLPRKIGIGIFSLGGVILSSDYGVLKLFALDSQYRWVQSAESTVTRVKRDYQAKQFIERGPDQIELQVQSDGDFRGTVHQKPDCLYTGLRFRIYVEAPVSESDDLDYHLRLGTAELTRVSVTGDDSRTVFLTIDEWETRFEDRDEEQFAERARARILGDEEGDISPFAKIAEAERINEFGIDEWRAIYDWANSDTSNLS